MSASAIADVQMSPKTRTATAMKERKRLAQRSQKRLTQKRIAVPLHRFRPFRVVDFRALRFGPRFAVPADLFHVVVQLEGEAVGVDGKGAVVDAGEQLGRQVFDGDAVFFEERDGVLQLL